MKKKFLKLISIIIIIAIITFLILIFLSNKIMPIYMNYAKGSLKSLITNVITKSINEDVTNNLEFENLFIVKSNQNTNITMIDFDTVVLNKIISNISLKIEDNLKLVSRKDKETLAKFNINENTFNIPSGSIFNTTFLNNLGPKIPISMEFVSLVNPSIETKVTEYGINNSLVEVSININSSIRMILPLKSEEIEVKVLVPITVKIIQGLVPEYYLGNVVKDK